MEKTMWGSFGKGGAVLQHIEAMKRNSRLDDVVRDKDEQIVKLNKLLCDTIAERDAALRETQALRQLEEVNAQLRGENSALMTQLEKCQALIEQLHLRVKSLEVAHEDAPSFSGESVGSRSRSGSLYSGFTPGRRARRESAGSLLGGSIMGDMSHTRLAAQERSKMHDVATRAMLLK